LISKINQLLSHVSTTRLLFFPALLITMTDPTDERFGMLVSLVVAFILRTSVTELWIRATHRSGAPDVRRVKAE
jgi:hypothetical protein